ncbi:DUF1616 domain-containing protein [Candidatus Uhrbacteria bacterium]|nr:DUF1616 domain-containing protein [Candidatus Uhrbacteria bacterium]
MRSLFIVVGILLLLFFPGWWASFFAFPMSDRVSEGTNSSPYPALDSIERTTLAIALSIVLYSAIVFVLYNFPGGGVLDAENFAIVIVLLNIMLFAAAAWRKRWIHPIFTLVLGIFPMSVILANRVFSIALTMKSFAVEVTLLLLVIILLRVSIPASWVGFQKRS